MLFHSTRNSEHRVGLSAAIAQGIAPDSSLYIPDSLPAFSPGDFDGLTELPDIAVKLIQAVRGGRCDATFTARYLS